MKAEGWPLPVVPLPDMHRYELGKRRATLRFCPTYDYFSEFD